MMILKRNSYLENLANVNHKIVNRTYLRRESFVLDRIELGSFVCLGSIVRLRWNNSLLGASDSAGAPGQPVDGNSLLDTYSAAKTVEKNIIQKQEV